MMQEPDPEAVVNLARKAGFTDANSFSKLIVRHSNGAWVDIHPELATLVNQVAWVVISNVEQRARSLYEITGDIKDLNTLLVQRTDLRAATNLQPNLL